MDSKRMLSGIAGDEIKEVEAQALTLQESIKKCSDLLESVSVRNPNLERSFRIMSAQLQAFIEVTDDACTDLHLFEMFG